MDSNKIFFDHFVEVKYSNIHGYGIFAKDFIPQNQIVMMISGETINSTECIKREEDGNVYIFWNGDNYIDVSNSEKIKFINHHCDSNCTVIDRDSESLYLYSVRDIQPGEEITIDYGYDEIYESCNCSVCSVSSTV